jgi:hypothetical protein
MAFDLISSLKRVLSAFMLILTDDACVASCLFLEKLGAKTFQTPKKPFISRSTATHFRRRGPADEKFFGVWVRFRGGL